MRRKLDQYFSEPLLVRHLLANVPIEGRVLEPCAGSGNLVGPLSASKQVRRVITNDIDPAFQTEFHYDATETPLWNRTHPIDWVVTNPPYNQALEIANRALEYVPNVALLLRLSWLEPTRQRGSFLQFNPPSSVFIFGSPRPSFTRDGRTDNVTVAWVVWRPGSAQRVSFITDWDRLIPYQLIP